MEPLVRPVNPSPPSALEVVCSALLDGLARDAGLVEPPARTLLRDAALQQLDALAHGLCGARLVAFGSYRLGAHAAVSDVDALALCPAGVLREDFLPSFAALVAAHARALPGSVHVLAEAFVPVVKFKWRLCGGGDSEEASAEAPAAPAGPAPADYVEFDVLFARLAHAPTLPPALNFLDESTLRLVAEGDLRSVLSLNGVRVNEAILALVRAACGFEGGGGSGGGGGGGAPPAFLLALRCAKLWARRRGVYGNALGYLGGVNLSVLLTFTAACYPRVTGLKLLERLFAIFAAWPWPRPVMLCRLPRSDLPFRQWEPEAPSAAGPMPSASASVSALAAAPPVALVAAASAALAAPASGPNAMATAAVALVPMGPSSGVMPILTPVFPVLNSAHNVSAASLRIIRAELRRGADLLSRCSGLSATAAATAAAPSTQSSLLRRDAALLRACFARADFAGRYRHSLAICVTAACGAPVAEVEAWLAWVETRLRHLPTLLETHQQRAADGRLGLRCHLHPLPWTPREPAPPLHSSSPSAEASASPRTEAVFLLGLDFFVLDSQAGGRQAKRSRGSGVQAELGEAASDLDVPVEGVASEDGDEEVVLVSLTAACALWTRDVVGGFQASSSAAVDVRIEVRGDDAALWLSSQGLVGALEREEGAAKDD